MFPDKIAKRAIESLESNVIRMQGKNYPAVTDGSLGELIRTMAEDGVLSLIHISEPTRP